MHKRLLPIAGILALSGLAAIAQTQSGQMTIEVVATNKAGFDRDLTAKDFKLWEDNKEQSVTGATILPPGKHAIVLLFDNTTVPVSLQADIRNYVARFIDSQAGPNLYMEVATYLPGIKVLQPFTTDAALLKASLTGTEATSRVQNSGSGGRFSSTKGGAAAGDSGTLNSQEMTESIRALVEPLAAIKGRKAVIFFTGGEPFSLDATAQVNEALAAANKANVAIDGISNNLAFAKTFADETGGAAIKVTQYLPDALKQIAQEQDAYYSVSFTPATGSAGMCHELRVKTDAPGVDVRARKLYCDTRGPDSLAGTPAGKELDAKLAGSAAGSLSGSLQAPYFYTGGKDARVDVVVDAPASGIRFQKEKGKVRGAVNVAGAAYRADGTVAAHFSETVTEEFADQKQADLFAKQPFHYENQLSLPPGQYTIKAVFSPAADAWGKAEAPLTIAPYDPAKLEMSGIALSRELRNAAGGAGLPADMMEGETALVASGHQIVPTGLTRFQTGERALFYAEIYEPALAGPNPPQVSMRFRVLDRGSGAVKSDSTPASVAGYIRPGNPVIGVASTVPTAQLAAGKYRLEITASHSSGPETVVRSVDFDLN